MKEHVLESSPSKQNPLVVGFVCERLKYEGIGSEQIKYPTDFRLIRVPCLGRMSPQFVLRTFYKGADGVFVTGCKSNSCPQFANISFTRQRYQILQGLLEFVGLQPERLKISWDSSDDGINLAELLNQVAEDIRSLGPNQKFKEEL